MTDQQPPPLHQKLEVITERVEAKFLSRYVVPGLTFLLLIVSGFAFNAIMNRLDAVDESNRAQENNIIGVRSDIRDINTRLDAGVIRQVNENKAIIDDHTKRLLVLERAVGVK